jgi:3-oxoacyl-[acyl-carrier-protein] synthase-3
VKKVKKGQDRVGIVGLGAYLPPKILSNEELEKMVDTSDEWILTRTGIKERRIAEDGVATSDLATEAAKEALREAHLQPEDVELLIVATITPDMQFPSTACLVQQKLGARKAVCFDVSAACAGHLYAIVTAEQFIKTGRFKNALVIGAEKLSSITDWTDRSTCVLFGDGAGACVLAKSTSRTILASYLGSSGWEADLLKMPGGGSLHPASHETIDARLHFVKMIGSEVFKNAVRVMAEAANEAVTRAGLKCSDIDCIIPHQANIRILLSVAKRMGLAENKVFLNISKYGNMSSASSAVALYEAAKEGRLKKGDIVVLDAFGGGFVWGACTIRW